jgi:hypothetical protein
MDLITLLQQFQDNNGYERIARNPRAQFGRRSRSYLGATILPERNAPANAYREDDIRYRTVIANLSTRYSPSQKKGGDIVGSFLVELAESDIAREFTGQMYDALLAHLQRNASMEAMASFTNWLDTTVNLAMVELLEQWRWQAIVYGVIEATGDNKLSETIYYADPAGHRAVVTDAWSDNSVDPFKDIQTMVNLLAGKGYTVNRIITTRDVLATMSANDHIKTRCGVAVVNLSGSIVSAAGHASLRAINGALQADGLPAMELYDLQYRTQVGTGFFLERGTMVFLATTGRMEDIDFGDETQTIYDTLGYTAIGRGVGQASQGRVLRAEAKMDKPPRIEAEGWQTALPVITEPEAIAVLRYINGVSVAIPGGGGK